LEPSGKFTMCVAFVRYAHAYVRRAYTSSPASDS
jgi:hypothetical protein